MVAMYSVFGRQVGSHVLAMITLGTTGVGSWLAMRGGDKKPEKTPPINAGSSDEEKFIKSKLPANEFRRIKGWRKSYIVGRIESVKGKYAVYYGPENRYIN